MNKKCKICGTENYIEIIKDGKVTEISKHHPNCPMGGIIDIEVFNIAKFNKEDKEW